MRLLILDIDGVLNSHEFVMEAESCGIDPACVRRFNRIIGETGCRVLLASAWRYMILGGAMTLDGFAYMLRTHGCATTTGVMVGHTRADNDDDADERDPMERGRQVREWIVDHYGHQSVGPIGPYVAIDDMELGYRFFGIPLVQTDGRVGLTDDDADQAIAILKGGS